ncbi:MAG: TerD family protein [Roseburia sp.]|nr:TerD family protein [Ruminococcus sp.]MCM1154364.1 TerD family protein [Roseburia sp.]MCM1242429.1 TerD family protein [Roseburia sp.]
MPVNLKKELKCNLTKDNPGLNNLLVGLGWNVSSYDSGTDFDLDAEVFMLDASGKCPTDNELVFYGNLVHASESVRHLGDNTTGEGEGDDEQIQIDLQKIPANISRIVFTVTIYEAEKRGQNFGNVSNAFLQVANAFIRVVNEDTDKELLKYDLGDDFSIDSALVVSELYRNGDEWEFKALGQGFNGGLAALCDHYGVAYK